MMLQSLYTVMAAYRVQHSWHSLAMRVAGSSTVYYLVGQAFQVLQTFCNHCTKLIAAAAQLQRWFHGKHANVIRIPTFDSIQITQEHAAGKRHK